MSSHFNAYVRCSDHLDNMNNESEDAYLLRNQMNFHWDRLTPKEIEALKFQKEQEMSTITSNNILCRQPKWSDKPLYWITDHETFLKIKALHKWYHQTVSDVSRRMRWDRKTVHQHGPKPEYCSLFVEEKGHTQPCVHKDPTTGEVHKGFKWIPKTMNEDWVDDYNAARMPYETEEKALTAAAWSKLNKERVDAAYEKAKAFFEKSE